MNNFVTQQQASAIESVLIEGDLGKLSQADRAMYYAKVCQTLGLNPLTKPFGYIKFDGRLQLYANKNCAEQLRSLYGVSITKADLKIENDIATVTVTAIDKTGRSDSDIGCLSIKGLSGDRLSNALMKCVTKAKRRVTLSICGLGFMDETEAETIPNAQFVDRPSYRTIDNAIAAPQLPPGQTEEKLKLAAKIKHLKLNKVILGTILAKNFPLKFSPLSGGCSVGWFSADDLAPQELSALNVHLDNFQATSTLMDELNMPAEEGQKLLREAFGKDKRFLLSFDELHDFRQMLQEMADAED